MKVFNTMSRSLEEFTTIEPGKVRMYVCGPTVYNYIHIGNARSAVSFDVIRKYLETFKNYEVDYISNFTDVDDKIINAARETGEDPINLAERFIEEFYKDTDALGIDRATNNPRATEYIDQMQDFINQLLDKGYAYESQGDVYFRVDKAKDYAKLAGLNLEELLVGASGRVDDEETARKESPADFALWKGVKDDSLSWKSPWGAGRPGWHIECSVMSTTLLGDTLDIHGGGEDLEFPHHSNEIAQSEAKTGETFVNYWMHNGFVNVEGEKMGKSLGNFKTVREILDSGFDPKVLRFFLSTTHYRRPLDFNDDSLVNAENQVKKIENAYRNLSNQSSSADYPEAKVNQYRQQFIDAMDDDFNIANGLSAFYEFLKVVNENGSNPTSIKFFNDALRVIGINFDNNEVLESAAQELLDQRATAKNENDFTRSDQLREELLNKYNVVVEDTKEGQRWRKA